MKINAKIIIVFSITIIILVESVGLISFQSLKSSVIDSEEKSALATGYGDVYIQPPYISPHIGVHVIAYVAKIKQNDTGSAIFHCEIPFVIFDEIVKTKSGTMSIVDQTGKTIASSSGNMKSKDADANISILNIINTSQNGFGTYAKNGESNYVVFEKLPTFGWSIVYEKPYSSLLSGNTSLNQLELQISIVAVSVGVAELWDGLPYSS